MSPIVISSRARRILWIAAALLVLYTVVGFFVAPPVVRAQLQKRLTAVLDRPVTVEKVRLNPYALSVTLLNLDIRERDGRRSFLGWKRLYVNFGAFASLTGDWVLSDIALDGFHLGVAINPDGTFNFSDLLAKFGTPPAPGAAGSAPAQPSRPLRVGRLRVTEARVDFADHSRQRPFQTTVGPLSFTLAGFRTVGQRGAPYHFEAVTEAAEKFVWTGTLSADPVHSAGEFSVENLALPKYMPYADQALRAEIAAGRLTVRGRYEIGLDPRNRVLQLADGAVSLHGLRIDERANAQPAIELAALEVTGIHGDGVALKGGAARVALSGGHLSVRREKDGTLNLLAMLPPAAPAAAATPAAAPVAAPAATPAAPAPAPVPPLEVLVEEVALKDFRIDVTDLTGPRPAQLGLSNLQCSLKNVTLADGAVMPLQLSLAWTPQGTLQVDGSVSIKPAPRAALKIVAAGLAILPLSPYVEQFVNARITQGAVSSSGTVQLAVADQQPALTFEGNVQVDKFGLVDGVHSEDLAGFGALALNGIKANTAPPLSLTVGEIAVAAPYARVVIDKEGAINLLAVAKPAGTPAASAPAAAPESAPAPTGPAAPAAPAPAPKIEIAKVSITDGDFSFTDHSLEPNVRMAVTQFAGTIAGLSADNPARADVDLRALVDGVGPVAVTGKLDPLSQNKFVDLTVAVKSVDLVPLSPYSGKFAGYELARGKLFVDITAKVADRRIAMSNVITLNQFTFGAPTNSPDATHLPVRLGVALLKDLDGKIVIDVPVDGSLDDPSFRIGKVVWRVIVNLLTKAATSPFSLLGSMFGGGGDELAYQDFAPGAAALLPAESRKLETLVKALTNRPGLNLDIEGNYDAAADTFALKQQKLADLIRRRIWEARRATDPNVAPPDQLTITPAEHAAMVKTVFDEKFPPGTEFGTPLPKPPPVVAPPEPPPGVVKRVVRFITFEEARKRRAAEREQARAAEEYQAATAAAVAAGLPPEVMTARLAETMEVTVDDLQALAAKRAEQVRDYLLTVGQIASERLFLAKSPAAAAPQNKGARVFLTLQ